MKKMWNYLFGIYCVHAVTSPGYDEILRQIEYEVQQQILKEQARQNPSFVLPDVIDINTYDYTELERMDPDDKYWEDRALEPVGYKIGLIIDPCRNRDPGCCQDVFGSPVYVVEGSEMKAFNGSATIIDKHGKPLLKEVSRLADRFSVWDPECFETDDVPPIPYRQQKTVHSNGTETITYDYNDPVCIGRLEALAPADDAVMPSCWDRNDSIVATDDCYTFDGDKRSNCIAVGYTQTAYIVQCGGKFALDNHCGTFLELHKPSSNLKEEETIISQTRLLGEFASGYRTTTLPLYYKGNRTKTICRGHYEIWWVQRTKYNFIVQNKKKFYVASPQCTFDYMTNLYTDYYSLEGED